MDKKYLIILGALLCIVVIVVGLSIKDLSSEEIRDNSIEALKNVDTYEFGMNITSEEDSILINGEVDSKNKKAKSKMTLTSEEMNIPVEIYLIDDVTHLKMLGSWTKKSIATTFDDEDYLRSQMEIIKYSEVEISENESSEKFYVLDAKPDKKKFLEYIEKQMELKINGTEDIDTAMKVQIEKDSNLPRKIYIKMKTKDIDLNTILEISEYNKKLDIKLPGEAKTAKWISEL